MRAFQPSRFAIAEAERSELRTAILFAAEQTLGAPGCVAPADPVGAAFGALLARIDADDRLGALRAIAVAKRALRRRGELAARDWATLVAVEGMSLALEHAERLAREVSPQDAELQAGLTSPDVLRDCIDIREPA